MKLLWNPITGFIVLFAAAYAAVVVTRGGYGLLDPLFWGGVGYLLYRTRTRLVWLAAAAFLTAAYFAALYVHMSVFGTVAGVGLVLLGWVAVTDGWSMFDLRRRDARSVSAGAGEAYFGPAELGLSRRIGDLQLDLSKWIIPEGEYPIVVTRWVGSVTVYVPYDLELVVDASALFGDVDVFGERRTGIGRRVRVAAGGYPWAERKVRLTVSTMLGDVTVRQL